MHWTLDTVRADKFVDELPKLTGRLKSSQACRQMRYANKHIPIPCNAEFGSCRVKQWFFEKKYAPRARESRHEMLRPLEYEIPTQMR